MHLRTALTHLIRNPLKQSEDLCGVKVFVYSLAKVRTELFLALDGTGEGQFPSFLVISRFFCPELVVDDLEGTRFFYGPINGTTVRTVHCLSSEGVYCLRERLAS